MAWMDTTMLLKFFGMSDPSEATKRRRSCLARRDGELLRFESMKYIRNQPGSTNRDNLPSIPWVTVTTSNASMRVKLSCNFFTKIAKGVCEPASAFVLRATKASRSSSWRRAMETNANQLNIHMERSVKFHVRFRDLSVANCSSPSMTPLCRSSKLDTDVCTEVKSVASSFNALLTSFSLADGPEIRSTSRRSVANTLSASALSLPVRNRKRMTRPRNVTASSGSSDSDDNFLKPGMPAAIAGETEMGGGGRSGTDEASERSLSLSLSLLLAFFFEETSVRSASSSTSWNTPSLRKAGRYSSGTLERRSSTSCKAPITRVGWSFDDRIEDAKLAIGTD